MYDLLGLFNFREPVNAWSHCLWLLLSFPATALLVRRSQGDTGRRLTLLVFGISLAICYAGSTLFHAVRLSGSWIVWFDQLDHAGIFILIAGSYTPVAWNLLEGRFRWGTLVAVWSASAIGAAYFLTQGLCSMVWSTCFYLVMGWGAVICYVEMSRARSQRVLFPLMLGGILYTVGAVINLVQWPVLSAGVLGPHEIFHFFVMGGSLAHFRFMLYVVAAPAGEGAGAMLPAAWPPTRRRWSWTTSFARPRGRIEVDELEGPMATR